MNIHCVPSALLAAWTEFKSLSLYHTPWDCGYYHLRRCDLCNTQAVGDELHYVFDCPRFGAIRAQYSNLFQDAEGSMRLFMWHKDQKAVSHCLTTILQMAQT